MNLNETALVLAQMQAYDQRTVGESDVIAWHALLVDAPFEDCQEAIRRHYAENTDRIMPAHVRRIVRDIFGEREAMARATGWAPGQAGVPKESPTPEVTDGWISQPEGLSPRIMGMLAEVRASLPEGSLLALKPREAYWAKEHAAYRRQQDAKPNPRYRETEVRRQVCRENGPHDDGVHIDTCPDAAENPKVCRGAVCNIEPCVFREGSLCSLA